MSKNKRNCWNIPSSQIREFDFQINTQGGIDYAKLCLDCLSSKERADAYKVMESRGTSTVQVSKKWRSIK